MRRTESHQTANRWPARPAAAVDALQAGQVQPEDLQRHPFIVRRSRPGGQRAGAGSPARKGLIFAAVVAVALHPVAVAGLAYAGGTLGTLLGADLVNLPKVRRLGAPVVSIGGAGTFDGIFITGIVAVLLASLL